MTSRLRLLGVPDPAPGAPVPAVLRGVEALGRARSVRLLGNGDLVTSAGELAADVSDEDHRVVRIVAVRDEGGSDVPTLRAGVDADPGAALGALGAGGWVPRGAGSGTPGPGDVVGHLCVNAPLADNTHRAEVTVEVADEWVPRGLDSLLQDLGEAIARQWGRTTVWAWTLCPRWVDVDSPEAVEGLRTPVPGTGRVVAPARTPDTDLLAGRGYHPLHSEWMTCLDVAGATATAPVAVAGYEVLSWASPHSPEDLLGELARIYALASTDMPSGGMSEEPEAWDPRRILRKEALAERSRQDWVLTAVRPLGGVLVGWTTLVLSPGAPEVAFQEGTLVRGDHRGRGLATWIKRVNLAQLRARHPGVRRVLTWNAGANAPVVAMNRRLGFRPALVEVGWEKQWTPGDTRA